MANTICLTSDSSPNIPRLGMSNNLTGVFISTLVLSGSRLAETNREKEFVIWLAQHDQNVVGIGTVGFDIDEMPWEPERLEENRQFVLRMLDGVFQHIGWEQLSCTPNEEYIYSALHTFREMIVLFQQEHVNVSHYDYWSEVEEGDDNPTIPFGYPQCDRHGVYLSCLGCVICSDD